MLTQPKKEKREIEVQFKKKINNKFDLFTSMQLQKYISQNTRDALNMTNKKLISGSLNLFCILSFF
jgi:hypothetical protein